MKCIFCQNDLDDSQCKKHLIIPNYIHGHTYFNGYYHPGSDYLYLYLNEEYVCFLYPKLNKLRINKLNQFKAFKSVLYEGAIPTNFSPETALSFLNKLLSLKLFL